MKVYNFSESYGHISENETLQPTSGIYKEKDTNKVGNDTFGDQLTVATVDTNGSLADEYIETIALTVDNSTVANTTEPTANGTWVLEPDPNDTWVAPDGGTNVSFETTISSDAPGGDSVALEIPPRKDADGDGSFDPGDTGLFFEQGDPVGGFGPGTTLTVASNGGGKTDDTPPPLNLSVRSPEMNGSGATTELRLPIRGSDPGRSVRGKLVALTNDSVQQSRTVTLDERGRASLSFETVPGRYFVRVEAVEGDDVARTEPITINDTPIVAVEPQSKTVTRGMELPVNLTLEAIDSATIRLHGPTGDVLESVPLQAENGSLPATMSIDTAGRLASEPAAGITATAGGQSEPQSRWIEAGTAVSRNRSPANPDRNGSTQPGNPDTKSNSSAPSNGSGAAVSASGSPQPVSETTLAAGRYTLEVRTPDGHRATAAVRVTDRWSAQFETFVAPRTTSVSSAADVRSHAIAREEIAAGDRLIVEVETKGLGNASKTLKTGGPPAHANAAAVARNKSRGRADRNGSASSLSRGPQHRSEPEPGYAAISPTANGTPDPSDIAPGLERVAHPDADTFYLVAGTAGEGVGPGATLAPQVLLTENAAVVPENGTNQTRARNGTGVEVVQATASLEGVSENGSLDLPAEANVTVAGSTSVAPGTEARIHIDGQNDSFETEDTATVEEDGTYATTTDLSEYEEGTDYTVSVTADGDRLSPLRSGEFVGEESEPAASMGGGGGGTGDSGRSNEPPQTVQTPVQTTRAVERTTTTDGDDFGTSPINEAPIETLRKAWSAVPKPLRFGPTEFLLMGLGTIALGSVGLGIRRLLEP